MPVLRSTLDTGSDTFRDAVDMTVGGVRRIYGVHRAGGSFAVDGGGASSTLAEVPRFPEPEASDAR
jgi:propionyl-CoA carboxylase alpha chain